MSGVTIEETKWQGYQGWSIENGLYSVVLLPERGGKIVSWIDKAPQPERADGEFVYFTPKRGGLLDDRGTLENATYDCEVVEHETGHLKLRLSVDEGVGIFREKFLTFYGHNRVIKVDYRFTNTSETAFASDEGTLMFRNQIRHSSGQDKAPPFEGYSTFTPLGSGVAEYLYPARRHGQDYGNYSSNRAGGSVAAGWHAQLDKTASDGLAVVFDHASLWGTYDCMRAAPPYTTFELFFNPPTLGPGKHFDVSFLWVMQRGLKGYTDVNEHYLAHLVPTVADKAVTFDLTLMPVMEKFDLQGTPEVLTEIRDLQGRTFATLPKLTFPRIWVKEGETAKESETMSVAWEAHRSGTHVVHQTVMLYGEVVGEYEMPFVVGKPSGEYVRGGATAKPIEYELTTEDMERGYVVSRRLHAGPQRSVSRVSCDVGRNESETVELDFMALRPIGLVPFTIRQVAGAALPTPRVRVRAGKRERQAAASGAMRVFGLVDSKHFRPKPGLDTDLWVTFNIPKDTPPGDYAFQLTVAPAEAAESHVELNVKVWDVTIADRRLSRMHSWWDLTTILEGSGVRARDPKAPAVFELYAKDLVSAGERDFHVITRNWDDLAKLDPFIEVALRCGLTDVWLGGGDDQHEMWEYLHAKGFGNIYIVTLDECALELPKERLDHLAAVAANDPPYVKRHAALSPISPGLINSLAPFIKIWNVAVGLIYSAREWQEEGKVNIPPDQDLGFYGGGAHAYRIPYREELRMGWIAGSLDLPHWSLFCYLLAKPTYMPMRSVFPTKSGPVSSSGWEGVRDGNDCFEYLKMAHAAGHDIKHIVGDADACPVKVIRTWREGMEVTLLDADLGGYLEGKQMLLKLLSEETAP